MHTINCMWQLYGNNKRSQGTHTYSMITVHRDGPAYCVWLLHSLSLLLQTVCVVAVHWGNFTACLVYVSNCSRTGSCTSDRTPLPGPKRICRNQERFKFMCKHSHSNKGVIIWGDRGTRPPQYLKKNNLSPPICSYCMIMRAILMAASLRLSVQLRKYQIPASPFPKSIWLALHINEISPCHVFPIAFTSMSELAVRHQTDV